MFLAFLACACATPDSGAPDSGSPPWLPPDPSDLPEQVAPPDPFVGFVRGQAITTAAQWEQERAPELRMLFSHYGHGWSAALPELSVATRATWPDALDGAAELVELVLAVDEQELFVLLVRPTGVQAPPVLLGLEKCGNHAVLADPRVSLPTAFVEASCEGGGGEEGRGSRAGAWDLEAAMAAGLAVAVLHQSELAPDDPELVDQGLAGAFPSPTEDPDAAWGAVGRWAWGLSIAARGLAQSGLVNADRIAVFGHSRRGKAALWAGARDPDIAMVWAHQSGTMGQALTRGTTGETLGALTTLYPHWFAGHLPAFVNRETYLPFDQHLLLALLAPRPVLVTDGADDAWANPTGASAAVELARPVWPFLAGDPADLRWLLREGEHETNSEDWAKFLEFSSSRW